MQADSSPIRWMWGFRIVVCTGLLFRDHTAEGTRTSGFRQGKEFGWLLPRLAAMWEGEAPVLSSLLDGAE